MFCILLLLSVDLQSGFYQKTITGIHYDILGMHHKQRQIQIMVQGFKLVLSWSVLVGRKKKHLQCLLKANLSQQKHLVFIGRKKIYSSR